MFDRRDFLKLGAAGGGAVFMSGLFGRARAQAADDFYFVQLSDSHWGFRGAPNPNAGTTLQRTVEAVNGLMVKPDFIVFTGDLTHTTDDPAEGRRRILGFKQIVAALEVKRIYFLPGEHDASLDGGAAFREHFGPSYYAFDYKGVHFIALDNVSDPGARLGQAQLDWLAADLARQRKDTRIVVLTHRPLFDLAPEWDWHTRDGDAALALLLPFPQVAVFYGHIHQEHHHMTGHIFHHAARSLIFPLPAPGSQAARTPLAWDPGAPDRGLGFREVAARAGEDEKLAEFGVDGKPQATAKAARRTVRIEAHKFAYVPDRVRLALGETVILELAARDFAHGFSIPVLKLRADLAPGQVVKLEVTAPAAGEYAFLCDNFCGGGHETMKGTLLVG